MNRTIQRLYASLDLLILALGIIALMLAQSAGFCLNDISTGAACSMSGTFILDTIGFALILIGATWAFARRWPASGALSMPPVRFLATWAIVVVVVSVWAYLMLLDWHLVPYCAMDVCNSGGDILAALPLFTGIGLVVAATSTAIGAWRRRPT